MEKVTSNPNQQVGDLPQDPVVPSGDECRRKPTTRFSAKLFLCGVATLIALAMCEVVLRYVWHNSYCGESPGHMLRLRIHPARRDYLIDRRVLDPAIPRVRLQTNERSYVVPSAQHRDPVATVAFLGGSTTECSAVQEALRFPALVSQQFDERGWKVNTLNAAMSGNTTLDSVNVLLNHVVNDRPDVVVMMHAFNDIGLLDATGDYRLRAAHPLSGNDFWRWCKHQLSSRVFLVGLARKSLARSVIIDRHAVPQTVAWRCDPARAKKIPVEAFRQRLLVFIDICRRFHIQPVLMTQPVTGMSNELTPAWGNAGAQDRFNAVIREVGQQNDVLVVDLCNHLKENVPDWDKPMHLFYDGVHVTDKGSEVYADHIADRLLPLIEEIGRQKGDSNLVAANP